MPTAAKRQPLLEIAALALAVLQGKGLAADISKGQRYFFRGDYKRAAEIFEQVVAEHPDQAMAHYFLGESYFQRQEYAKAKAAFLKALELKPDYDYAHLSLARTCYHLGNLRCAREQFHYMEVQRPEELEPKDRAIMAELGPPGAEARAPIKQSNDTTPPSILVTTPAVIQGRCRVGEQRRLTIKAVVTDDSPLESVTVNGVRVLLDQDNQFVFNLPLRQQQTKVQVVARDAAANQAAYTFVVERVGSEAATSAPPPLAWNLLLEAHRYAVVIGSSTYHDRRIPPLGFAAADARASRPQR